MKPSQSRIDKGMYWDLAWSLVEGCTPVSEGCLHCWSAKASYMRRFNTAVAYRHRGLTEDHGRFNGKIRTIHDDLKKPLEVSKPMVWAVWNDLFHEDVPEDFILRVWTAMGEFYGKDGNIRPASDRPEHTYLVLTKRPTRALDFLSRRYPHHFERRNVGVGATIENQPRADERLPVLLRIPVAFRFVSVEPMLSPINVFSVFDGLHRTGDGLEPNWDRPFIDWVIIGCENGGSTWSASVMTQGYLCSSNK